MSNAVGLLRGPCFRCPVDHQRQDNHVSAASFRANGHVISSSSVPTCRTSGGGGASAHDSIQVRALHVSKGLVFPVVVMGAGRIPAEGEDELEEVRLFLFYVGATRATRATRRLVMGKSGNGRFASRSAA